MMAAAKESDESKAALSDNARTQGERKSEIYLGGEHLTTEDSGEI
jgi:hypothetical protein